MFHPVECGIVADVIKIKKQRQINEPLKNHRTQVFNKEITHSNMLKRSKCFHLLRQVVMVSQKFKDDFQGSISGGRPEQVSYGRSHSFFFFFLVKMNMNHQIRIDQPLDYKSLQSYYILSTLNNFFYFIIIVSLLSSLHFFFFSLDNSDLQQPPTKELGSLIVQWQETCLNEGDVEKSAPNNVR